MTFNSYVFIILFLPILLTIYFTLCHFKKYKTAKIAMIIGSLIFYAYASVQYLWLLIGSILFNFAFSQYLSKTNHKKIILFIGIIINIGFLYFFKYFNFTITIINQIASTKFNFVKIILPLGISFFTFQQIAFLIDSYKGEVAKYTFLDYAAYITFFPQITAGPISLYYEIIPQFESKENKRLNIENLVKGIYAFSFGFAKKILLADTFARAADIVFANPGDTNAANLIIGILAYTFQIYFDFSGYCDMGIGVAKMFNIDLPINFNSPYQSLSITEFWKRWHITLNRFFTKYIYIPLGGSKKGKIRTYINIFIIFLISGMWHGANYTFLVWGIMQGVAVIIERMRKKIRESLNPVFQWLVTFSFINISWLFFRANSLKEAWNILKTILKFQLEPVSNEIIEVFLLPEEKIIYHIPIIGNYLNENPITILIIFFIVTFFGILCMKNTNERLEEFQPNYKSLIVSAVLFIWSIISISGVSTFIYVNF